MKEVKIIDIPDILDTRGNLAVVEECREIPFQIKRVFWIYGVKPGETRASHAHKELYQCLVAVSGSLKVWIDNGYEKEEIVLDSPSKGLLIPPKVWITLKDFTPDAVCLVMAPSEYDPKEYIKNYQEFIDKLCS